MPAPFIDVCRRFGQALRDARLRAGLTQERLAERSGLSYKFIGEIERGRGNPTLVTMLHIADALGVALTSLLDSPAPSRAATVDYGVSKRDVQQAVREAVASVESAFAHIANPSYKRKRPAKRHRQGS